jgi:hypothetical protein
MCLPQKSDADVRILTLPMVYPYLLQEHGLTARFTLPRIKGPVKEALPPEGRKVLQILVMTEEEAEAVKDCKDLSIAELTKKQQLSIDLAIFTSFCKLLSLYLDAMEGAEGSGPLDNDIQLILKGKDSMSPNNWNCVLYRAGQKRILREYLKAANTRLVSITEEMKEAMQRPDV